jgi:hypothetical protein
MGDLRLLAGILNRLTDSTGKRFDALEFWARFRIQKSIYLLQAMGYPGPAHYRFSLYLRGPYSPELAKDYYALEEWDRARRKGVPPAHIPQDKLTILKEALGRGEYFLEALVTLHSILVTEEKERGKAIAIASRLKPERAAYFEPAWEFLADRRLC